MEAESAHEDKFEKKHTKNPEWYHPSRSHIFEHTGKLETSIWSEIACIGNVLCGSKPPRYRCCNEIAGEKGCVAKWSCCKEKLQIEGCKRRYTCCQRNVGKYLIIDNFSFKIKLFIQFLPLSFRICRHWLRKHLQMLWK